MGLSLGNSQLRAGLFHLLLPVAVQDRLENEREFYFAVSELLKADAILKII